MLHSKFNLSTAILQAEAGDVALWEDIARHLIAANKPKAKRASKKACGAQTWACVRLADGRCFLTSAYARQTNELTESAHAEYAQFRGRMEDSGDNSAFARMGLKLNQAVKAVAVVDVRIITNPEAIQSTRLACYHQRAQRQGWIDQPEQFAIAAE